MAGTGTSEDPTTDGSLRERAAAAAQVFVADAAAPVLEAPDAHHLLRVLRLRPGEVVVAADGKGHWARCRIRPPGPDRGGRPGDQGEPSALLELDGPLHEEHSAAPALTVAFAPVKGDRPEWVVQKLTEIGIDRIVPLQAERSVVRWAGPRSRPSLARLRRVARESAAQSRRLFLPEVTEICTLADLARMFPGGALPWLADPGGRPLPAEVRALAVGPEGGWSPAERGAAGGLVGLGPTILRSDTAAVVAGALLAARRSGALGPGPGASEVPDPRSVSESARCAGGRPARDR